MTDSPRILGLYAGQRSPKRVTARSVGAVDDVALPEGCVRVGDLCGDIKGQLEALGDLRVVGEVASFKAAAAGHWYFDLKDRQSKLSVVIFHTHSRRLEIPEDGDLVVVTGNVSFHAGFGKAQLMARHVAAVGEGELRRKLEALKARLAEEGLFALERKRPLPAVPRRIGIVTSRKAAALHDVLRVIRQRHTGVSVVLCDTKVQGDGAGAEVADAIRRLDDAGLCDVILVVRGGGAREDLHAFDSEPVVRAIAHCKVPVVAGVGHETDTTLADLVADVRAATPSQAAELAVPREDELRRQVGTLERRLVAQTRAVAARQQQRLVQLERRVPPPAVFVARWRRPLEALEHRLEQQAPRAMLRSREAALTALQARLRRRDPREKVSAAAARLERLEGRLGAAVVARANAAERRLEDAILGLDALSPLAVLRRGFALVTVPDDDGRLADADDLTPGTSLRVRLDGAAADVTVTARLREDTNSTGNTNTNTNTNISANDEPESSSS